MPWQRTIVHVDMDAFFAAIEQLDNPALRGKAIVVGSDRPRGVVTTASYEARPFGCHSAQPVAVAKRLCPHLLVVPIRGERYRECSRRLFELLDGFSPTVEPISVDEAFLDMTGSERLLGDAAAMGRQIRQRVREELQLTASVGIAPNKFLAKLASDHDKPDGLTIIEPGSELDFLRDLPIGNLWGVGPKSAERLQRGGIRLVGQLAALSPEEARRRLGNEGEHFWKLANGIDDRRVTPDHSAKSISHETTFEIDVADPDEVRAVLLRQVELVVRRLRRVDLKAGGTTVKIRYGDFQTITRAKQVEPATDVTGELWQAVESTFDEWVAKSFQPVRLIGAAATRLSRGGEQLTLFPDAERDRQQKVDKAADAVAKRFGKKAIRRGRTLQ